ncbi:hypothetical protein DL240_03725 [Lujinxingia litoralis]|uniref:Hemerythrin-like domain-containing protein n=1 Tax=Lujinxingia litoralis TaxID=2211119 RepID=A0A328CCE9_9DELT|nr:hemerythrin domain-containing protein [Lujinxingia litoralis]RAL25330.1 hypothetical protein DL240_03725 [Lujinxingia litoralis]
MSGRARGWLAPIDDDRYRARASGDLFATRRSVRPVAVESEAAMEHASPESNASSDLIDRVHHEHVHLRRLFEDLSGTFERIGAEQTSAERKQELIESASEDMAVALDDMLEHFNQEEEIFFVEIEERFPELGPRIDALVKGHELMGQRTRWLHEQLGRTPAEIGRNLAVILDVVRSMAKMIDEHTTEETTLFDDVLTKIPADERRELLEKMREI